jgi:protein involved in polysaccharide export with SLBB domain
MKRLLGLGGLAAIAALVVVTPAPAQAPDDTVRVGDRILLDVEGEPQLRDTFAVTPGPTLTLPVIGPISLAGVRRSEAEPYLARQLAGFLKHPVVHARVLVRLAVLGEVQRPGFYAVPADAVLTDAIMAAGGPTRDAKLSGARIERDAGRIWSGNGLQQAMARGMTVTQMDLRSGDRIMVPRHHDGAVTAQILGILLTVPAAIYGLSKLH